MEQDILQETLFWNGRIYTVDAGQPWAEALLVRDGRIAAVGPLERVGAVARPGCTREDLRGRFVMPGIHDAHIHLLWSGLKFRSECRLRPGAGARDIVEDLCTCAKCLGGRLSGWIVGGEVNPNLFAPGTLDRAFLDEAFPEAPVYLYDYSIHHAFVNSRALAAAGIDATTADPYGGRIVRRAGSSEPTGELVERATWAVKRAIPPYPDEVYRDAVIWAVGMANRFGITSVQEASAALPELQALAEMERRRALSVRVAAHLVWQEESFGGGKSRDELERLIATREEFASEHVRTDFVKCWLDGAPLPPHFTHCGIDPETGDVDYSKLLISEDELFEGLQRFDREGVTLKIHCGGEGAVRIALNAIERVRDKQQSGITHEIAHAGFVHPQDLPRLAPLNAVAEMSPAIWHYQGPEFAGLAAGFKFRSLRRAGATMTIGSDWIITPDPNLFPALQGILERGAESVDLADAIEMMTLNGARATARDAQSGSLAPGKWADFIVLDRNLFEIPASAVGETRVLQTYFEGRRVFDAGSVKSAGVAATGIQSGQHV